MAGTIEVAESPTTKAPARSTSILVALNPSVTRFSLEKVKEAIEAKSRELGVSCRFITLPKGEEIAAFLDREVGDTKHLYSRVIAVGGDGTVGAVASVLARRAAGSDPIKLGIVPSGTANVFARELGLPAVLEDAVSVAVGSEETIEVDSIEIAGRHVFTQVGVGPDAVMIRDTSREHQEKHGRLAYMFTYLRHALRPRTHRFRLTVDGDEIPVEAWQIVAANTGTLGIPPFTWGPRIDPTDGVLDVCLFDVRKFRDRASIFWRVLFGRFQRGGPMRFLRARNELTIDCDRALLVQGDGEILGRTPVTLRVVRNAASIVVARRPVPVGGEAAPATGDAAEPGHAAPTVTEDVEAMMAQHSRTWILQGAMRHPLAAFEAFDAAVFLRLNSLLLGHAADRVLTLSSRIMHYGEGWGIAVLGMIIVNPREGMRAALEILPVLWLTMLTVNFPLKRIFRRRRPFLAFVKARVLGPRPKDFSLPSGHSAAAFAGAHLLSLHAPAFAPLFYSIAVIVGLSRVYLGVHYPSDVAIGAAVGIILATLYRAVLLAVVGSF